VPAAIDNGLGLLAWSPLGGGCRGNTGGRRHPVRPGSGKSPSVGWRPTTAAQGVTRPGRSWTPSVGSLVARCFAGSGCARLGGPETRRLQRPGRRPFHRAPDRQSPGCPPLPHGGGDGHTRRCLGASRGRLPLRCRWCRPAHTVAAHVRLTRVPLAAGRAVKGAVRVVSETALASASFESESSEQRQTTTFASTSECVATVKSSRRLSGWRPVTRHERTDPRPQPRRAVVLRPRPRLQTIHQDPPVAANRS
jgi:hypothetical protein